MLGVTSLVVTLDHRATNNQTEFFECVCVFFFLVVFVSVFLVLYSKSNEDTLFPYHTQLMKINNKPSCWKAKHCNPQSKWL